MPDELLVERDIPTKERNDMADSDFVYPDTRSYPIKKKGDVTAAVHAWGMGKHGKSDADFARFKARVRALAKKHGLESEIPQSWDENAKESVSMGVIPPADLGYMAQSPIADAICAQCCYFIAGQTSYCQKVRGAVEPQGWCRSFEPEHGDDESSSSVVIGDETGAPAMPMMQSAAPIETESKTMTTLMTEAVDWSQSKLDLDNRVLKDVVLIQAGMSKNRKLYTPQSLQNAVSVFEGAKAFADHPTREEMKTRPERSINDTSGWYKNVRYHEGRLVADRYFARTAAGNNALGLAQDVVSGAAPATLAGLSINAIGTGKPGKDSAGDYVEVEKITYAISVDDVTTPAAGGAYKLTASGLDPLLSSALEVLSYEEWFESRPEYRARLQNEMKKVRQDEAIKAEVALKEAALSEANRAAGELQEAQALIAKITAERDAAIGKAESKARELAVEKALTGVSLKNSWKEELRTQLLTEADGQWPSLIEAKVRLAADTHNAPRVAVAPKGEPTAAPKTVATIEVSYPRPGENSKDWMDRISKGQ